MTSLSIAGVVAAIALMGSLTGCTQTRVTGQTASAAKPSAPRIDISSLAREEVNNPQKLCDRIPELKQFPWHEVERGWDPVYDEITRAGPSVVPCLIEKVTDTNSMPDLKVDLNKDEKHTIGDVAVWFLGDILHSNIEQFIPDEVKKTARELNVDPYYYYVEKPAHRKDLQDKLWDWYHRMYQTEAQRRAQLGVAPYEFRQVKTGPRESARLEEKDGRCVLVYNGDYSNPRGSSLPLDLQPPCEFVRNETGAAEMFAYLEEDKLSEFWVVMVVGGPLDPSRSDPYMQTGCGTQIQAIKMRYQSVTKSPVGTGITVCPSVGVREKIYSVLAKRQ